MAEAVFSISAEITPELNDRELQKQAQNISKQIESVFGNNIKPVTPEFDGGGFLKNIQDTVKRIPQLFTRAFDGARRGVETFAKTARAGIFRFTDAIKLTQREVVGFGRGLIDTVKRTGLFEKALEKVGQAGGFIQNLGDGFKDVTAQILSGVGPLADAAASGDRLAQFLQPIATSGAAASLQLGAIGETIKNVANGISNLGKTGAQSLDALAKNSNVLEKDSAGVAKRFQELAAAARSAGFDTLAKQIEDTGAAAATGNIEDFTKAFKALRAETDQFTGVGGRIRSFFQGVTKEQREAALEARKGFTRELLASAPETLSFLERTSARFSIANEEVGKFGAKATTVFRGLGTVAKSFLDKPSLEGLRGISVEIENAEKKAQSFSVNASNFFKSFGGQALKSVDSITSVGTAAEQAANKFLVGEGKITSSMKNLSRSIGRFVGGAASGFKSLLGIAEKDIFPAKAAEDAKRAADAQAAATKKAADDANRAAAAKANLAAKEAAAAKTAADAKIAAEKRAADAAKKAADEKVAADKKAGAAPTTGADPRITAVQALAAATKTAFAEMSVAKDKFRNNLTLLGQQLTGITNMISAMGTAASAAFSKAASIKAPAASAASERAKAQPRDALGRFTKAAAEPEARAAEIKAPKIDVKGPLKAAGDSAKGEAVNIGKEIVSGIALGAVSGGAGLVAKLGKIKGLVIGGLKKLFRIASPSGVARDEIGVPIAEGIAQGVGQGSGLLQSALSKLLGAVQGVASTIASGLANAAKVTGVALAGLGGTALFAGIKFNELQQVVNATLPVILGSASASKDLLAEINALNDSSPFARSSFLELTKVLAGFGVEAEKITPLIDSIQQTVAATGGGEQDLAELGQAFARLQSQGKLSGDILQSFSSRGVDVLNILAKTSVKAADGVSELNPAFGQTTTAVRDLISEGLIPADLAIDSLTKGLKEKFDGATEGVSKNLPGALDRIRAKLRDLGAALTKAFVDPEGGGALVDLLNAAATAVGALTKIVVPIFTPALEKVANVITKLSEQVTALIKPLTETTGTVRNATNDLRPFLESMDGLVPVLAVLAGAFPAALGFLPTIGPILAQLGGGFGALAALFVVVAIRSKEFRDSLVNLFQSFSSFAPVLQSFGDLVDNVVGRLGPIFAFLTDTIADLVPHIAGAFQGLIEGLDPIVGAIGRLLEALKPAVSLIKDGLVVAFDALKVALPIVGNILAGIIDVLTRVIEVLTGAAQALGRFIQEIVNSDIARTVFAGIGGAIETVSDIFVGFINGAIKGVNVLIRAINKVKPGKDIKQLSELEFNLDISGALGSLKDIGGASGGLKEIGKGASEAEKALAKMGFSAEEIDHILKGVDITSKAVALTLEEQFNIATKAAEKAQANVAKISEELATQQANATKQIDGIFAAAQANADAQRAVTDARRQASEAHQNVIAIEKEYAKALRDTIKPEQEIAQAERTLARTRREIANNNREVIDTEKELAELRDATLQNDKRAALDRAIERAKIALNKARRDEIELQKEANKEEVTGINLSGLSLDQVRSKLANARFSLQAAQQSNKQEEDAAATAQEKEEERISRKLDVADAEQSLKDAIASRAQFESDLANNIRDTEERIIDLRDQGIDLKLQEVEQQNHLNDLLAGETALQQVKIDFQKRIQDAKQREADAQRAITEATRKSALAAAELALKTAEINRDTVAAANAQQRILDLKGAGLNIDKQTQAAIQKIKDDVNATVLRLEQAQRTFNSAEAARLEAEARFRQQQLIDDRTKSIISLQEEIGRLQNFQKDFLRVVQDAGQRQRGTESAINALLPFLNNLSTFATIGGEKLTPQFIQQIASQLVNSGSNDLLAVLREILRRAGITIPGLYTGYAPGESVGEVHRGMNDGRGLVRMFEYGKEAVLPLTRKLDMMRVVQNPNVLPAILDALPRVSLPQNTSNQASSAVSTIASMRTAHSTMGSQVVQTEAQRKNEQKEFASYIGEAVRVAVKDALADSGSLGADVDINVQPSSNNEVLIANEVRRQVKKLLGL